MAQRRQIRVSRSLEGGGERPATGYGEPEAGVLRAATRGKRNACPTKQTGPHGWLAVRACVVKFRRYLLSRLWHYHRLWKLNYRVRDGNGCDLPDMFTGNSESPPSRRGLSRRFCSNSPYRTGGEMLCRGSRHVSEPPLAVQEHSIRVVKRSSVSTG